ncbi:MAG: hypothetical protein NTW19_08810 [Planctomycetota bacterium]|nr:hypothetical protein [Planctomycetota bacterium]
MTYSRIVGVVGFLSCLLLLRGAPCLAVEDNPNWGRPMGLGVTPVLPADASGPARAGAPGRIEEVKFDPKNVLFVTTTSTRFEWGKYGLIVSQRLPVERELLVVRGAGGQVLNAQQLDDATCLVETGYAWVTVEANAGLIVKAKQVLAVDLLALFKAGYHAQVRGCHLAADAQGGFGVFPTDDEAFEGQSRPFMEFWYRLKPGQELWLSFFPQQPPPDSKAGDDAAANKGLPPGVPVPGPEVLRLANVAAYFHNAAQMRDIRASQDITGQLYRDGGKADFNLTNTLTAPLSVTLKWDAPGWKVSPTEAKLSAESGAKAQASFTFAPANPAGSGGAAGPAPRLLATYDTASLDGKPAPQTHLFAFPVNESTEVPRLPALGGLDAVADALKDQPPRVVATEGNDYVETRRPDGTDPREPKLRLARGKGDISAEIRLAVAGDSLAFHAKVADPRCTPEIPQWSGGNIGIAGVDFYVSKPGSRQVRQFHFRALSPTGEKTLIFNENGSKAGEPTYPCKIVALKPFGYEVHALIPLKDCLLDSAADPFLFDVALLTKEQFSLLYTGDPVRCAYRNNRYFGMAVGQAGGK